MIGVCIHCPVCAGEHTTGDWCTRHNRELSVIEDEYFPYIGAPEVQRCDCCGNKLHKSKPKQGILKREDG